MNISTDEASGPWLYGLLPPELLLTDRLCVSVNGEGTTHVQPVPAKQREGKADWRGTWGDAARLSLVADTKT